MGPPSGKLSDKEIARLDKFLERAGDRGLVIDSVEGLFAALVCSPVLAMPSQWMPVVWGGESPEWKSLEEAQEVVGLLMRMWNDVAHTINDGTYSPLMTTATDRDGREVPFPHAWCMGFFEGMRMHQEFWFDETNEDLQELLDPITMIVADAAAHLRESRPRKYKKLSSNAIEKLAKLIPDVVVALRLYWLRIRPPDATAGARPRAASRRAATKVGRNDPCPCGSGNKYKNCCGREGPVH